MSTEFKIPELGENVTSGDVVRVLVKPGDTVAKDQPILELETDKATIEVPSTVSGTVKDIKVKQGDKVSVGQTVLTVDGNGAAPQKGEEKAPAKAEAAETDGADAAKAADKPKPQPAGAPEEGGLSQEAPGRTTGTPAREDEAAARPKRGEVVEITRGARPAPPPAPPQPPEPAHAAGPAAPAAPSVRRLARELGVEIQEV